MIEQRHFETAFRTVFPSVSAADRKMFEKMNLTHQLRHGN
jgi:hypothetical protein